MKIHIAILTILISSLFVGCTNGCCAKEEGLPDIFISPPPRRVRLQEYDYQKAGAVIAVSFDITESVTFRPINPQRINAYHSFTVYDNSLYIKILDKIYVFDKQSMVKKNEITLNLPAAVADLNNRYLSSLLVTGSGAFLYTRWSSSIGFFSVDISTGGLVEHNIISTFGIDPDLRIHTMGYDKADDLFWIQVMERGQPEFSVILYFRLDETSQTFIASGSKNTYFGRTDEIEQMILPTEMVIHGPEKWELLLIPGYVPGAKIDKRTIDNPEVLYCIDTTYLGIQSVIFTFTYDKPYIWIMAQKGGRIQMLKLLPN